MEIDLTELLVRHGAHRTTGHLEESHPPTVRSSCFKIVSTWSAPSLREISYPIDIIHLSEMDNFRSQLGTHDEALVGRSFTWPRLHDKYLHDVTIAWHMIAWQACAWNTFEWQKYRKHDGTKPWHTLTGRRITFTWRHKYMNVTHVTPKNNYMTYDYMT